MQPLKRHARLLTEKTDRRGHPVALENIESWTGRYVPTETEFEGEGVAFQAGDVLFGKLRPYLAKTLVAEAAGEAVGDFLVIRPSEASRSRFLAYQLRSREVISIIDGSTYGSKMPRASWEFVGSMPLALPPIGEQNSIVTFLDRETAKIDALVEEQRRLIELLKEKRQAVISQAVTKGLDRNVPMKASGVEWLGEVPAHWEVVRLKRVVVFQRGHDLPADARSDGPIPVVSSGGFSGTHDVACASAPGIVTGRYGSIGQFTLVEKDYWPLNTALYSIQLFDNYVRYVWYVLHSTAEHFLSHSLKSAVPGVDRNDIHEIFVVRAPLAEQHDIARFLDQETQQIDLLVSDCELAIAVMGERRSALISAAVTGKIDVRGLTPQ
jgi:type I restriction enzyme S subunit